MKPGQVPIFFPFGATMDLTVEFVKAAMDQNPGVDLCFFPPDPGPPYTTVNLTEYAKRLAESKKKEESKREPC